MKTRQMTGMQVKETVLPLAHRQRRGKKSPNLSLHVHFLLLSTQNKIGV